MSAVPPLPRDPGKSRFHIKGLAYRGLKQVISHVPGGLDGFAQTLDDARLRAFLDQPFLAASRYDILPMLPLSAALASRTGKPLQVYATQQGAAQARHDVERVYRRSFEIMKVEDPVRSMNRFEMLYYDFGDCSGEVLGHGHVVQHRRGLPEYLLPWFAPMHAAYVEELFRMKGVAHVETVCRPATPAGTLHGLKIVDLDTDIRWR